MKRPEQQLHQAVYRYIRYAVPHVLCFHVPNGGWRSKAEAGIFKSMGVMPGVADLLLFWPGNMAAIELKAGKGTQTAHQTTFMHMWIHNGGKYSVCRSIDEVEAALKVWKAIA